MYVFTYIYFTIVLTCITAWLPRGWICALFVCTLIYIYTVRMDKNDWTMTQLFCGVNERADYTSLVSCTVCVAILLASYSSLVALTLVGILQVCEALLLLLFIHFDRLSTAYW
jgi:hypothetical protein